MKKITLINLLSLLAINILILVEVKDLFDLEATFQNLIITVFAFFFSMLILIMFVNILFNFILRHLTSFDLDYEQNQEKVLNSIFIVNQILFLALYLLLLFDETLIYTLQNLKYITPLVFAILFSVIMKLKLKDFVLFNVGVFGVQAFLLVIQKLFIIAYNNYI
ncbi:hypothetical protein [Jeotgalibacillus marinus]|uniref:Uncharacterized protein n=1 Tax=Jeotgalibacillus marinus TaxID=86667 RepID=A0ABV3Q3I6_9BACL